MDDNVPLVSIITPSFNQDKFIEYAILSVKNQCYTNIEHIIVDGESTDNTLDIIRKYEGKYNLQWISEPDQGQSDAINKGFKMAKGVIIGWINSDDAYFSNHTISMVVNFFNNNTEAKVAYGDIALINEKNEVIRLSPVMLFLGHEALKIHQTPSQPAVFFRRSIIDKYSLDVNLIYSMDYDFWLKVGKEHKFHYIKGLLSCFRIHNSSKSVSKCHDMDIEIAEVERRYFGIRANRGFFDLAGNMIRLILPAFSLFDALKLYNREDFAFNLKLPSKTKIIRNTLLLNEISNKINHFCK